MKTLPEPHEDWKPLLYTKPKSFHTLGNEVIAFIEAFLIITRGNSKTNGKRIKLMDWQKWLLRALLEIDPDTGFLRYSQVILLLPRKNGKSFLASAIMLYLLVFSKGGEQFFCAATNLKQAHVIFDECVLQVQQNPWLRRRITVRKEYLENNLTKVKLRPVPADGDGLQGFAPTASIGDEIADFPDNKVFNALTQGSGDQDWSLFIGMSTVGSDKDSLLGERYEYGEEVVKGNIEDDSFGFFVWGADEADDVTDEKTWYKANPSLASGALNIENLRKAFKKGDNNGKEMAAFMKFRLNLWVRTEGISFLSPQNWFKAEKKGAKIPKGSQITIGFDGSRTDDSCGFIIQDVKSGLMDLAYFWENDSGDTSWKVPRDEVEAAVHKLFQDYDVRILYGDIAYYGTDLDNWAKIYPKRIYAFNGNISRMGPFTRDFLSDLYKGEIFHTGNERFTAHALHAVLRENGLPGKERRNSPKKIDFLQCAILSNAARRHAKSVRIGMPSLPR